MVMGDGGEFIFQNWAGPTEPNNGGGAEDRIHFLEHKPHLE